MRIYFSANTVSSPPEELLAVRKPHVMISFYFLSSKGDDKGAKKRIRILLKGIRLT